MGISSTEKTSPRIRKTNKTRKLLFSAVAVFILLAAVLQVSVSAQTNPQPVSWTKKVKVTSSGNSIVKTKGCDGCLDAGAISVQKVTGDQGFVEFMVSEENTFWAAGLSNKNVGTSIKEIKFALRFNGAGWVDVVESGVYKGGDTTYQAGDVFRITASNGKIEYSKNGKLIHTSTKNFSYPLLFDTSLGSMGASVNNVVLAPQDSVPIQPPVPDPTPTPNPAPNCGLTDSLIHTPPSIAVPGTGQSYTDPVFGCTVTRLTNAAAEGSVGIVHQYSSVNPFNSDSTYVLLDRLNGIMHIRDLNGNIVRDNLHNFGILGSGNPFWSRTNPNIIYFHPTGGNQLKSYNVVTNQVTALYTFNDYSSVSFGMGEGDISWDGDHLPVVGDGHWGFIHTISTGVKSPAHDLNGYGAYVDNVDVTPQNRFAAMSINPGSIELFDQSMNHLGTALDYQGHADRGGDINGNDIYVITNSADYTPIPNCPNGIVKKILPNGAETCLQPLDWSNIVHISCNNVGQGWCLVSTYSSGSWTAFKDELFKVNLDGSGVLRLAHTRSSNNDYYETPRAAVSPDGRYVLFDSTMSGSSDVYLLEVPQG